MAKSKVAQSAGARNLKVARKAEPAHAGVFGNATLNEVLDSLGWRSEPHGGAQLGRRVYCAAGHSLGVMTAGDTWDELRARGLWTESLAYPRATPYEPRHCQCTSDKEESP